MSSSGKYNYFDDFHRRLPAISHNFYQLFHCINGWKLNPSVPLCFCVQSLSVPLSASLMSDISTFLPVSWPEKLFVDVYILRRAGRKVRTQVLNLRSQVLNVHSQVLNVRTQVLNRDYALP